ncbi:MAG: sensor histidine kinase, partial [Hyphomicrobiaceae bacterium]
WTTSARPRGRFAFGDPAALRLHHAIPAPLQMFLAVWPVHTVKAPSLALSALSVSHTATFAALLPSAPSPIVVLIPVVVSFVVCLIAIRSSTQAEAPSAHFDNRDKREPKTATGVLANGVLVGEAAEVADPPPAAGCPTVALASATQASDVPLRTDLRNELMARVCHELRTPLNAVVGFSDVMESQMFGPLGHPRYEEYVAHISESSRKLLKSAEDTLAMTAVLTGPERARSDRFSLAAVVHEAVKVHAADLHRKHLTVTTDIADEIEVTARRRAIRQAVVNLLAEAIARAEDACRISIRAGHGFDKVALDIAVEKTRHVTTFAEASLPICLARTLLELDGAPLHEREDGGIWRASTELERALQTDFFIRPATTGGGLRLQ